MSQILECVLISTDHHQAGCSALLTQNHVLLLRGNCSIAVLLLRGYGPVWAAVTLGTTGRAVFAGVWSLQQRGTSTTS